MNTKSALKMKIGLEKIARQNYLKECSHHPINSRHYLPDKQAQKWLDCIRYLNDINSKYITEKK